VTLITGSSTTRNSGTTVTKRLPRSRSHLTPGLQAAAIPDRVSFRSRLRQANPVTADPAFLLRCAGYAGCTLLHAAITFFDSPEATAVRSQKMGWFIVQDRLNHQMQFISIFRSGVLNLYNPMKQRIKNELNVLSDLIFSIVLSKLRFA